MRRPKDLPRIGEHYDCYDDGKISASRRYDVEITDVIPFSRADNSLLDLWDAALKEDWGLFDEHTDYFIKAVSFEWEERPLDVVFARTKDKDWFGLGAFCEDEYGEKTLSCWFGSGLLDVDGSLTKSLK